MKTILFSILLLFGVFIINGCTTRSFEYYEGLGDYRYHNADSNNSFEMKYVKDANISGQTFQKYDNIAIYLKTIKLNYISEGFKEREIDVITKYQDRTKNIGEIALIADIKPGIVGMQGGYNSSSLGGKLIYYSGDFHEKQSANQSFSPVYGPIEWDGKGLSISITVLEIDKDNNEQFESLLKTLSSASRIFTTTGSPASQLLETIGQQLINSNKDDVLGHYTLHLMPQISDDNISKPVLHTGDLILVRQVNRTKPVDWNSITYNPKTGLLNQDSNLSYIVFTFAKPSEVYDNHLVSYDEFVNSMKAKNKDINSVIDELSISLKKQEKFNLYKKQIKLLDNGQYTYAKNIILNDILYFLQCSIVHNNKIVEKVDECKSQNIFFDNEQVYYLIDKLNAFYKKENINKIDTIESLVNRTSLDESRKNILNRRKVK